MVLIINFKSVLYQQVIVKENQFKIYNFTQNG